MGIQKKLSEIMRMIKEQRGLSVSEFAEELNISRTALQEYLSGTSNPRADTIDQIAEKLSLDPVILVSGLFTTNQIKIIHQLLDTIEELSSLSPEQRKHFAKLFCEMINLWSEEDGGSQ